MALNWRRISDMSGTSDEKSGNNPRSTPRRVRLPRLRCRRLSSRNLRDSPKSLYPNIFFWTSKSPGLKNIENMPGQVFPAENSILDRKCNKSTKRQGFDICIGATSLYCKRVTQYETKLYFFVQEVVKKIADLQY